MDTWVFLSSPCWILFPLALVCLHGVKLRHHGLGSGWLGRENESLRILSTAHMSNLLLQNISLFGEKKSVGRLRSSSQIQKSG
jgi:hypothetical protein